jgi:hypothetical protein
MGRFGLRKASIGGSFLPTSVPTPIIRYLNDILKLVQGGDGTALHTHSHTAASHSDQGATGAELETLTDGSNADSLHIHNTKAEIATGTYEGNGATSYAPITNLNFTPSYVKIWESTTGSGGGPSPEIEIHEATIYMTGTDSKDHTTIHEGGLSESHISGGGNRILSMESGGFTVADGGADAHPNKSGIDYYYLAIG